MNNNSKVWTIIQHEYYTRIKSKGFIISTLLGPLLMLLVIAIPILVTYLTQDDSDKKLAILDRTEIIGTQLVKSDPAHYFLSQDNENILKQKVQNKQLDGFLVLNNDFIETGNANTYFQGSAGIGLTSSLEKNLGKIWRRELLLKSGADTNLFKKVDNGINLNQNTINSESGKAKKSQSEVYAGIGYVLGLFIYFMMLMYGSLVMRGVIEEKSNRIIEVINSSVKPFHILIGKVVGIGAVGLTQVLVWAVIGSGLSIAGGSMLSSLIPSPNIPGQVTVSEASQLLPAGFEMPHISIAMIVLFIYFFLAGYFIYSSLYAAIGSAVDQEQDAAQLQAPITIPIIIPILLIGPVISNPEGILSIVLSLIPFFSPILMVVRIAASEGNLPFWQIAASIILTASTFLGCLWISSKIYRVGILMYGKKPNLKDLIKWIRLAK